MIWAFAQQGEKGLTDRVEGIRTLESEAGTAQMTSIHVTESAEGRPLKTQSHPETLNYWKSCGKLLFALILVESALLFISTALQDICVG